MNESRSVTILCLTSQDKGHDFLRECRRQGARVILLTREKYAHADWPHDSIDEIYFMPTLHDREALVHAVSYLMRHQRLDRIVALDDLDVESAAALREHLRVPGMGETTARYFRDKLAMRMKAREEGILVPEFVPVLNYNRLREFMAACPAPWVLKPRSEASSVGIKKLFDSEALWRTLDTLGDRQSYYVLERYVPGDVFHVDSVIWQGKILFTAVHKYTAPPLDVMQGGGIFCSRTLPRDSADAAQIRELNERLVAGMRLARGVTHTEFIKGHEDGEFYFLETAARVGGANIAEMVEAASGVNLWTEWAKVELADVRGEPYEPPVPRSDYAGVLISLSRQEWPDTSSFDDPEIVWRMPKRHHAGLIVRSPDPDRVETLLHSYLRRFATDFSTSMPAPESLANE